MSDLISSIGIVILRFEQRFVKGHEGFDHLGYRGIGRINIPIYVAQTAEIPGIFLAAKVLMGQARIRAGFNYPVKYI